MAHVAEEVSGWAPMDLTVAMISETLLRMYGKGSWFSGDRGGQGLMEASGYLREVYSGEQQKYRPV